MKKFLIVLAICVFMASTVQAGGGFWKDLFIKEPPAKKAEPTPVLNTVLGSLPINLNGDTLYLLSSDDKGFVAGVGIDLATWKNIVYLRGEVSSSTEASVFAGIGPSVNIPALFTAAGVTWSAGYINPSVGIIPGYNFGSKKFNAGILLSIIQVTF